MNNPMIWVDLTDGAAVTDTAVLPILTAQTDFSAGTLPTAGLYLQWRQTGLSLAKAGHKGEVRVDFVDGSARHRRMFGGGELLAKAVQAKNQPLVWDGTGGLGRDAFVLASLGLPVVVFERHPVVYALLYDGLCRAWADQQTTAIAGRIQLIQGSIPDMNTAETAAAPDVVYLDPMYPQRQKSAAVKKEMAYFHELVGASQPEEESCLLHRARQWAQKRVVVKRPRHGMFLADCTPAFQYHGKTTRFDVYLPHKTI
ncbi:class I SAM-dependent methyltransferase [Neisseriaceae bacterium ESL0693]|nr:class I SAM-dependent methyltransferase [Neisseriaceae bacterium ESL0693]